MLKFKIIFTLKIISVNCLKVLSIKQSVKCLTFYRSHCTCDQVLYQCLKAANHPTANFMGQIYFNIVKVPCIEDIGRNRYPLRKFVPVKRKY